MRKVCSASILSALSLVVFLFASCSPFNPIAAAGGQTVEVSIDGDRLSLLDRSTVTFSTACRTEGMVVELLQAGQVVETLAADTREETACTWTVSSSTASGDDYQIRATAADSPTVFGTSGSFSIFTYWSLGGSMDDVIAGVFVDGSGKMYLTGYSKSPDIPGTSYAGGVDLLIAVLNPDGSLDNGFAEDGMLMIGGSVNEYGGPIAVDGQGRITTCCYSSSDDIEGTTFAGLTDLLVVRVNPDGSLDTSFDSDGKLMIGGSLDEYVSSGLFVDGNGNTYLAGFTRSTDTGEPLAGTGYDWLIVRLGSDGAFDSYFSGNGRLIIGGDGDDRAVDLTVESSGAIYVCGESTSTDITSTRGGGKDWLVVKLDYSGNLVTGFGDNGKLMIGGSGDEETPSITVDSSGKVYLCGASNSSDIPGTTNSGGKDWLIVRLNSDGSFDSDFDGDGRLMIGGSGSDRCHALSVTDDGGIVLAGKSTSDSMAGTTFGGIEDILIAKLNADGSLDTRFDGDGMLMLGGSGWDSAYALCVRDGYLTTAGSTGSEDIPGIAWQGYGDYFVTVIALP